MLFLWKLVIVAIIFMGGSVSAYYIRRIFTDSRIRNIQKQIDDQLDKSRKEARDIIIDAEKEAQNIIKRERALIQVEINNRRSEIEKIEGRIIEDEEIKNKIVSQVQLDIPTFTKDNLPKELMSIDPVKPGSRNL